jgi:hypothetical protein
MVHDSEVIAQQSRERQFEAAFQSLQTLVDWKQIDLDHPRRENAVYKTSVILWMLIFQRLNPDATLEAAVKKLLDCLPALLPNNKRVREKTLSAATGTYSRARNGLPLKAAQEFAKQVSQSLIEATPPSLNHQRVFVIDGTTLTLPPEPQLRREFPPASNQHGQSVWPLALVVVAHELASGTALEPAVGAMYGDNAVSETALIKPLLTQMPPRSVVMTDSGFGIFAVAWDICRAGHDCLLALTKSRFDAHCRHAALEEQTSSSTTYRLTWRPSAKERRTHPDLPAEAELSVRMHELRSPGYPARYVLSTLAEPAEVLSSLYDQRYDIEVDLRNIKVVLDTENIRARTPEMFRKELVTSTVAYNLVTQFRSEAASRVKRVPRGMSFKRTWTTFRQFLLESCYQSPDEWRCRYAQAMKYAMQDKLPNRPGRHYERECYPRRPKSNQFKKRIPKDPPDPKQVK